MKYLITSLIFIFALSCARHDDKIISKDKVGKITSETKISDIGNLFKRDSIAVHKSQSGEAATTKFLKEDDTYQIYSRQGKLLLTVTPVENGNPDAKIKSVEVSSGDYHTEAGLNIHAPFKDFANRYTLELTPALSSVMVEVKELDATFLVRLKNPNPDLLGNKDALLQSIPDMADIEHFTLWFQ
jgi:hypothetical protein